MSSLQPATVRLSFAEFSRHGGLTGPHADGWGIAHYQGRDVCLMKEAAAASDSPLVEFVQENPPTSRIFLSHIRKATQGEDVFENCQPLTRELGGRVHTFAHNGNLERAGLESTLGLGGYSPVGNTDSEYAFCSLMKRLAALWHRDSSPSLEKRTEAVAAFAAQIRPLGPANFIYSDGELLLIHGHRRTQRDGKICAPGLHILRRACRYSSSLRGSGVAMGPGLAIGVGQDLEQQVVLAASVPLSNEPSWEPLAEGELVAVVAGRVVSVLEPA